MTVGDYSTEGAYRMMNCLLHDEWARPIGKLRMRHESGREIKRLMVFFTLLISVSACGFQSSQTKRAQDNALALDEMIDVGGYRLHINCSGRSINGSPTVVMDAGGYDSSETWIQVQPEIAKFARVCVYDRAGLGKSESRDDPSYPGQDIIKDLHTLLVRIKLNW